MNKTIKLTAAAILTVLFAAFIGGLMGYTHGVDKASKSYRAINKKYDKEIKTIFRKHCRR